MEPWTTIGAPSPPPLNEDSIMRLDEIYLPRTEEHKLRGAVNFVEWIIYFVGITQQSGHWRMFSTDAPEGAPRGPPTDHVPALFLEHNAWQLLRAWVSVDFHNLLDEIDIQLSASESFRYIQYLYDPTREITAAVLRLRDMKFYQKKPACLYINKWLVFQSEINAAGATFSDNLLLKLALPNFRVPLNTVYDQFWIPVQDHGYSDILEVIKAIAVYEVQGNKNDRVPLGQSVEPELAFDIAADEISPAPEIPDKSSAYGDIR